jgi:hypothetical protein
MLCKHIEKQFSYASISDIYGSTYPQNFKAKNIIVEKWRNIQCMDADLMTLIFLLDRLSITI